MQLSPDVCVCVSLFVRLVGGETGGDIEHVCHQRMATSSDDCLTSPRRSPSGDDVML